MQIDLGAAGLGLSQFDYFYAGYANGSGRFDYLFLDPPYADIREYHHALRQSGRGELLKPTSWVIVEHSRHCILEDHYGALRRARLLRHGDAQLAFYRLEEA